jgi:hypothetical protein
MENLSYQKMKDAVFSINELNRKIKDDHKKLNKLILELSGAMLEFPPELRHKLRMKIEDDELILNYNEDRVQEVIKFKG